MTKLNLNDAPVFLAIARTGTLTAAAKQLGTGIATVSRKIERLEQALGVTLFLRHQTAPQLIYAALRSNAKGLFPPNDECSPPAAVAKQRPMKRLEYRSSMTAKYNQPELVQMCGMSPAHFWFGDPDPADLAQC